MRELKEDGVDRMLGRSQLDTGNGSDRGRALAVVVEDPVQGHGVKSEERSVLHVVRFDGRHAAGEFCKYDGVEADGLIRGHENASRGEKNGEKRKGNGSCGRGARRRGRAVGEHQGLVLYFIAATLTR